MTSDLPSFTSGDGTLICFYRPESSAKSRALSNDISSVSIIIVS